jgi:hypothetical protein
MAGISEEARMKVRLYFEELQETLRCQEVAAMAVVDAHVRERLAMLKQQQEDMAVLLSQISSVCHQCEKTLKEVCFANIQCICIFILYMTGVLDVSQGSNPQHSNLQSSSLPLSHKNWLYQVQNNGCIMLCIIVIEMLETSRYNISLQYLQSFSFCI